jgi:hypothetical protein
MLHSRVTTYMSQKATTYSLISCFYFTFRECGINGLHQFYMKSHVVNSEGKWKPIYLIVILRLLNVWMLALSTYIYGYIYIYILCVCVCAHMYVCMYVSKYLVHHYFNTAACPGVSYDVIYISADALNTCISCTCALGKFVYCVHVYWDVTWGVVHHKLCLSFSW